MRGARATDGSRERLHIRDCKPDWLPPAWIDLTDDVYEYIHDTDIPVGAYRDAFYAFGTGVREIKISNLGPGATYNLEGTSENLPNN